MAGKISTLVLEFYYSDFCCRKCRLKIAKTLFKLQEKEDINSIIYDDKNSTVTIDGPFYPERVSRKIQSKLGKMIKNIKTVDKEAEKKKKEEEEKKKKEEAEKKKKEEEEKKKKEEEEKKKKEEAEKKKKEEEEKKKKEPTILVAPPYWPAGNCCHMPCIVSFQGGCRCCSCGWMSGAGTMGPPMFYPQYYRENCPPCYPPPSMPSKFFWEETTPATCSMM